MKKSLPILAAAGAMALAGFSNPGAQSQFAAHQAALGKAKSATIVYTVQTIPGLPVEHHLVMARPSVLQWQSPSRQVALDGTTLWVVDPVKKEYTEAAMPAGELAKRMASEPIWIWSGFFGADPFKDATGMATGVKRNIKGVLCSEVTFITAPPALKAITAYVDAKTGLVRGFSSKVDGNETLVIATLLELSDATNVPAFAPPKGMAKVEKPAVPESTFADVSPIFLKRCMPCHSEQMRSGRLDLSSYATLMAAGRGRTVVPGDPAKSEILMYLRGERQPAMPKDQPPLPEEEIKAISDWILGGAKG